MIRKKAQKSSDFQSGGLYFFNKIWKPNLPSGSYKFHDLTFTYQFLFPKPFSAYKTGHKCSFCCLHKLKKRVFLQNFNEKHGKIKGIVPKALSQRVGSERKALRMRLQMGSRRERDPLQIRRNSAAGDCFFWNKKNRNKRNLFRRGAPEETWTPTS